MTAETRKLLAEALSGKEKIRFCNPCGERTRQVTRTSVSRGRSYLRWCCRQCESRYAINRRRKNFRALVEERGGACEICGYSGIALEFHHRDPEEKLFEISHNKGRSIKTIREESDKCDLLCSNCHKELHAAVYSMISNDGGNHDLTE